VKRKEMKKNIFLFFTKAIFLALVFGIVSSSTIYAQEDTSKCNDWQFQIAPYFVFAGLNGTAGVRGVSTDVDMSFSDIWDKLNFGFMMAVEVRKGSWGIIIDGIYFKLEDQKTKSWNGPLGRVNIEGALEATMTEQIYEALLNYRFEWGRTNLDFIAGIRYTRLDLDLNLVRTTSGPLLPDSSTSVRGESDWFDPVLGARVYHNFSPAFSFTVYQDFGGFGISSDLTYQFLGLINWTFFDGLSAKLGYRFLYQNYEKDDFIWNTNVSGPMLGIGLRF
jgi:hypothetical protein